MIISKMHTSRSQRINNHRKFISLGFLNIILLIGISDSASLKNDHTQSHGGRLQLSSTSAQPSSPESFPEKRTLDSGRNPSELAWQAWLLFDNAGETDPRSSSDSANMYRRITPKSIFIAPPLPICPEGYQSDGMNRCVKNIQIDQDAHINFLLERLNAMYANLGQPKPPPQPEPQSASSSSLSLSLSQVPGPFQLNIPLVMDSNKNDTENGNPNEKPESSDDEEAIVTVYEVKDMKEQGSHEEKEQIFLVPNQITKVDNNDNRTDDDKLVPLVGYIQESDANITSIVDYDVPIISKSKIQNRTEVMNDEKVGIDDRNVNVVGPLDKSKSSNDSSSTVVLVLSPSGISLSNDTRKAAPTSSASTEQDMIKIEIDEKESTSTKKIIDGSSQDIETSFIPIPVPLNNTETFNGSKDIEVTTVVPINDSDIIEENKEPTPDYTDEDEEEYDVTTDHSEEDFDTSTESAEEILKHSEAGLTVTTPIIRSKPPLYSSDRETNSSAANVSSIVSINEDFIRETTLLGVNGNSHINISKDSKVNDDTAPIKSPSEKNAATPTTRVTVTTPEKIVPVINPNDGEHIDLSIIAENITTGMETTTPLTIQIDEISLSNSDAINPVVTIEEALMDEAINYQEPSFPGTIEITSPNNKKNDKSGINKDRLDSSEMMTASSTNVAKIIFPREEIHGNSPLTSSVDETHNIKYIRASSPPKLDKIENNILTTPPTHNNKQRLNYDAILQHHPNHHTYLTDENRAPIKFKDEHRLEPNINGPVVESMYNHRFGLNANQNHRKNFFPSSFDTSFFDPTGNHVRFPTHKRPHTRPNQVRFPSDEANSIHTSDDLKEKYNRPLVILPSNSGGIRAETGGLTQSNWRLPLGWRSDHQQSSAQRLRSNTNEQRRDRSPMLMKFWTKMPLVKDPSLLYHPTYPTVVPVDTVKQHNDVPLHSTRIVNFYDEISAYDQMRTFARQTDIDG